MRKFAAVKGAPEDTILPRRSTKGIFQKYYITDDDDCVTERTDGFGSTGR